MKRKRKVKYMHVFHGHPATYDRQGRRVIVPHSAEMPVTLYASVATILRQQRVDREADKRNGIVRHDHEYGYRSVYVD